MENQYVQPGSAYDFKTQQSTSDDYTSVAYYYLEGSQDVTLAPYHERVARTKAIAY